jgi:hypothetical protein
LMKLIQYKLNFYALSRIPTGDLGQTKSVRGPLLHAVNMKMNR